MRQFWFLGLFVTLLIVMGCASFDPIDQSTPREFTYDFIVMGKTQNELWRAGRDFFAEAYSDSNSVIRVMDEQDGTILGKGTIGWWLAGNQCFTEHHVRFASKDGKARLQFELINAPANSRCGDVPTKFAYDYMRSKFDAMSARLETTLKGQGTASKLKDF